MSSIEPTIKYIERFKVTGLSVRTQNRDESNETTAKIPNLWHKFYTSKLAGDGNIFGVYSNYDSDANGLYILTVGIESNDEPTKFDSVNIQPGNYLVFQDTGPMPATVIEVWKQIWSYFATHSEYQRNFISDFEKYTGPDQVTIYIGIKLKK